MPDSHDPDPPSIPVAIIAAVQSRGSDAADLRDAAHEACHALETGIQISWDRDSVHAGIWSAFERPADRFRSEVLARAVERIICGRFDVEYDPDKWLGLALMESVKNGISVPFETWKTVVDLVAGSRAALDLAERIISLGEEATLSPPTGPSLAIGGSNRSSA